MLLRHPIPKSGKPARTTVLARMRTAETAEAVARALPERDVALTVEVGSIAGLALGAVPDALLLDLDFAVERELAAAEDLIAAHRGRCAMVVTSPAPSVDGMRRLMRLGITDLLPQPIQGRELYDALMGGRAGAAQGRPSEGLVLSVLKGGGGAGATSLTAQAACALGVKGRDRNDICVLDLDIQFGAVGLHLDLSHGASVLDVIAAGERLDGTMLRSLMAHHRSGIDVLPAPRMVQPLHAIEAEAIVPILALARREYARTLVDLPQSWTGWTRAVLASSDRIALVLTLSVPSIRLAQRQLETIADEGLSEVPLCVVANRVPKGLFAEQTIGLKEAEAALERRIDHVLPADAAAMFTAANLGLPLAEVKGGDKLARRMAEVVTAILAPPSR